MKKICQNGSKMVENGSKRFKSQESLIVKKAKEPADR